MLLHVFLKASRNSARVLWVRVLQNASKSKFQGGGLPKLASIPNKSLQKELGFFLQNFGKSAHFQVPENGTSSARIQKLRPTSPQNDGVGVCFLHLPLLDA